MTPPLVLIAEDDAAVRGALQVVLSDEGFRVAEAADGVEALELARSLRPDVVLLDGVMPGMGGREVLREMRSDPALVSVPVLVLSGLDSPPSDWEGATVVGKPFDPDEVVDLIRQAL